MNTEEKTKRLLEMQEHPERYTEEEIRQLMADEECRQLYEQMVKATDALFAEDIAEGQVHDEIPPTQHFSLFTFHFSLLKLAAAFIGLLMLSGIAYAAVHIAKSINRTEVVENVQSETAEPRVSTSPQQTLPTDSIPQARVFENTPLDEMVTEIAAYYNKVVDIQNKQAHELRLYYKWNPSVPLESVVEDLNHFDRVNLAIEDDKLIVKP